MLLKTNATRMRLDDYTPDSVCKAMGLESFAADSSLPNGAETLRIVFLPSFHPEVAATFSRSDSSLAVSVVALQRMLWLEPLWARLPDVKATTALQAPPFSVLRTAFTEARSTLEADRRCVATDGMGIAACYYSDQPPASFEAHSTTSNAVCSFTVTALRAAWEATADPRIANALAKVALYLGIKYPFAPVEPEPTISRLLVLGTPAEREDYFDQLSPEPTGLTNQAL